MMRMGENADGRSGGGADWEARTFGTNGTDGTWTGRERVGRGACYFLAVLAAELAFFAWWASRDRNFAWNAAFLRGLAKTSLLGLPAALVVGARIVLCRRRKRWQWLAMSLLAAGVLALVLGVAFCVVAVEVTGGLATHD